MTNSFFQTEHRAMYLVVLLVASVGLIVGCGVGPCKENTDKVIKGEASVSLPTERIRVYKPDGSLQCGMGAGVSPAEMQKQLNGIKVYSSANKPDGLMHIQLCGSPTGICNVYEIDRSALEKAQSLGFREWTWD